MRICAHCNNVYNDGVILCPVCNEQTFRCSDSVYNDKIDFDNSYPTEDNDRQNLNIAYRNDIRTLHSVNTIVTAVLIMVAILSLLVILCQDKLSISYYIIAIVSALWVILLVLFSHFLVRCLANHFESSLYYNERGLKK